MDRIFVIHLYVRYVINVLLLMSFAKHKKNPHFVLGTNRGGLVIEWGRLLNSQNFRRNSIVRIDHSILFIVIECNFQVCQLKSFYYKNNPF